ncbi:MAG TPA: Holliday junction branch migration protein RuvA [Cyclobacteriaceae bacterium]|jgi:Holliday junction DNA helicase RuvA
MITYVIGKFVEKQPGSLVVESNGIGYKINISLNTFSFIKEKKEGKILTYLHIKEDAHILFGFATESERQIFLNLISISGVGPGTGLMVMSSLSPEEVRRAIVHEDVKTIQSIKGIGGKTAQRIILELKDKMAKTGLTEGMGELPAGINNSLKNEALSALITLGINKIAAEKSIDFVLKNSGDNITLEELIKRSLKTS